MSKETDKFFDEHPDFRYFQRKLEEAKTPEEKSKREMQCRFLMEGIEKMKKSKENTK